MMFFLLLSLLTPQAPALLDSIVKVNNPVRRTVGTGFGLQTTKSTTVIITAGHLCWDTKTLNVIHSVTGRTYRSRVIALSVLSDLCAIEAPKWLASLPMAPRLAELGTPIATAGHPGGGELRAKQGQVIGWEAFEYKEKPNKLIIIEGFRFNVRTVAGQSGSPVVNQYNQVVGVIVADESGGYPGTGFAAPLNYLTIFISSYLSTSRRQ